MAPVIGLSITISKPRKRSYFLSVTKLTPAAHNIPDDRQRDDQRHSKDRAPAKAALTARQLTQSRPKDQGKKGDYRRS